MDESDLIISEPAESIALHLPSALPPHIRNISSVKTFAEKERKLREAQADSALTDIRRQRRILSGLYLFKKLNVSGPGIKANTRMHSLFKRFNHKTLRCAERYRAAREALVALDPSGKWSEHLRPLHQKDIRGPGKDVNDPGSNGRYEPSWIWLVPRATNVPNPEASEDVLDDSLRVEWSKTKARMERWEEEVLLIQEEMRRVVEYLMWKADWWRGQTGRRSVGDTDILHGVAAYAHKQAAISSALAVSCVRRWTLTLRKNDLLPGIWEQYVNPSIVVTDDIDGDGDGDEDEVEDDPPVRDGDGDEDDDEPATLRDGYDQFIFDD